QGAQTEISRLIEEVARLADTEASAQARHAAAAATLATAQRTVEAAWESVNAAESRLVAASAEARGALARLAEARGARLGALGGDGGVARAAAQGTLAAWRLADSVMAHDPADQDAVAAALEHAAGAWVVGDLDQAVRLLERPGPRELVLPAGLDVEPETVPGPWRSVFEAVEVSPLAAGAVSRLLRGTWLAADHASAVAALQFGATAAVLPDGKVVTAAGVRGGDPGAALALTSIEHGAESDSRQWNEAESAAITASAAAREDLAGAERELAAAAAADREAASAAAQAASVAAAVRRSLAEAQQRYAALMAQRDERLRGEQSVTGQGAALRGRRDEAAARREAAARHHGRLAAVVDSRRAEAESAASALRHAEIELAREEAPQAGAAQRSEELARMLEVAVRRGAAAAERLDAAETALIAALALGRAAQARAGAAAGSLGALEAQAAAIQQPLDVLEEAVRAVELERSDIAVALARAGDEQHAAAEELRLAADDVERLAAAARDESDDDSEDWDPDAAEKAEREIARLERKVAALGAVNAMAPEQHAVLAERVAALHRDGDDLRVACDDIRHIAGRLTRDVERRFEVVFADVSQRFGEVFAELFPGGRAALRLEESAVATGMDDDEAAVLPGVEILAQPPGKRLGPLRLLSGGERALTALATVLALQQVNPSPFYVFDEVDAALDDSNVLRFTRLLRRLAEAQQFIVVTHNHITMAAADVLWGVTIDADGVSSVLGVRFDADAHSDALTGSALRPVAS
ncbi:MAG: hypothetical protein JOZ15_02995, partial [Acidobacteria bacterium]|nr:hypothetical protein [Acidobacteriota bacterium]